MTMTFDTGIVYSETVCLLVSQASLIRSYVCVHMSIYIYVCIYTYTMM